LTPNGTVRGGVWENSERHPQRVAAVHRGRRRQRVAAGRGGEGPPDGVLSSGHGARRRIADYREPHPLTGDRKGVWSLFVTKNGRMTFRIDHNEIEIIDLDY